MDNGLGILLLEIFVLALFKSPITRVLVVGVQSVWMRVMSTANQWIKSPEQCKSSNFLEYTRRWCEHCGKIVAMFIRFWIHWFPLKTSFVLASSRLQWADYNASKSLTAMLKRSVTTSTLLQRVVFFASICQLYADPVWLPLWEAPLHT